MLQFRVAQLHPTESNSDSWDEQSKKPNMDSPAFMMDGIPVVAISVHGMETRKLSRGHPQPKELPVFTIARPVTPWRNGFPARLKQSSTHQDFDGFIEMRLIRGSTIKTGYLPLCAPLEILLCYYFT